MGLGGKEESSVVMVVVTKKCPRRHKVLNLWNLRRIFQNPLAAAKVSGGKFCVQNINMGPSVWVHALQVVLIGTQ